jgi:phosphoribosyl 1,2-cyclic phosphate phosphodiesterase
MKLTILGSGTSHGIPMIGCDCPVCRSGDTRDKRTRASLYIQGAGGERAVIDTGPEFRLQALRAGIDRLDALFFTHAHADHLHGLDDVRPLTREIPLPVYGNRGTIKEIKARFSYVFKETQWGGGKPRLNPIPIRGPVRLGALTFTPLPVKHGALDILGWRIDEEGGKSREPAVYLTDTNEIPPSTLDLIGRPAVLFIDGLRTRPHETHFTFKEALNAALTMGARRVYLTHICHDYTHEAIKEYCRRFREQIKKDEIIMEPAWDGLEWEREETN